MIDNLCIAFFKFLAKSTQEEGVFLMKKNWLIVILAVLLMSSLAGCKISLSTPPPSTPTAMIETPFVTPVGPDMAATQMASSMTRVPPDNIQSTEIVILPDNLPTQVPQVTVAPIVQTPVLERPATYALQKGEWPICIARRYDLNLDSFFAANGLTMNSRPAVGTVLKIPATGNWNSGERSLKSHPASYTVRAGDTIYTIACDFGDVDPNAIVIVNNLVAPYTLQAGQVLQIP
jgi:LysM repeat protein